MNEFEKITLNNQDYLYNIDINLVYSFTHDQIEYVYTQNQTEITEVITTKQLHNKLELNIQSVLCCKNLGFEPVFVILAIDNEQAIQIFCYHVSSKQINQVVTKTSIKNQISEASITQDPFDVVFKDKKYQETKSCYGLVIGTVTGHSFLALLHIDVNTFESKLMSIEPIKSESKSELGIVTSIHILPPDKRDRRMGHSDPQILLGYSKGAVLIYRYRANIYASNANRLRAPVDLSEFTEFPDYPITHLSGVRSYNSLGMTVVFSQEKPLDNVKYGYSRSYVKIVETHGDSTLKQRKIINPPHTDSTILATNLLLSHIKTTVDPDIQLSILLQNKDTIELEIWFINPTHIQRGIDLELDKETCFSLLPGRNLRSRYYRNTPQRLAQIILEHQKNLISEQNNTKRKAENETSGTQVNKKHKSMGSSTSLGSQDEKDYQNIPIGEESELSSPGNLDSSALAEGSDLMDFENLGSELSTDEGQDTSGPVLNEQTDQAVCNTIASNLKDKQTDELLTGTIDSSVQESSNASVTNDVNELVQKNIITSFKSFQQSVKLVETNVEDTITKEIEEPADMADLTAEDVINADKIINRLNDDTEELAEIGKADDLPVKGTAEEIIEEFIERTETDYVTVEESDVKPITQAVTVDETNKDNEEQIEEIMEMVQDEAAEITGVKPSEQSINVDNHGTERMTEPVAMDVHHTIPVDETKDDSNKLDDDLMEIIETNESVNQGNTAETVKGGNNEIVEISEQVAEDTAIDMMEEAIKMAEAINSLTEDYNAEVAEEAVETSQKQAIVDGTTIAPETDETMETHDLTIIDNTVETTQENTLTTGNEYIEAFEIAHTTTEQFESDQTNLPQDVEPLSNQLQPDNDYNQSIKLLEESIIKGNLLELVEQITSTREESQVLQGDQSESDQEDTMDQSVEPTSSAAETSFLAESEQGTLESTIEIGSSDNEMDDTDLGTDEVVSDELAPSDVQSPSDISFEEEEYIPDYEHESLDETDDIPDYEHESLDETDDIPDYEHESLDETDDIPDYEHESIEETDDIPDYEHESLDETGDTPDYEHDSFDETDNIPDDERDSFDENDDIPDYEPETSEVSYSDGQAIHISDDSNGLGSQGDIGEDDGLGSPDDTSNEVYNENEEASIILSNEDSEYSDHAGEIPPSKDQGGFMKEVDENEDSLAVEADESGLESSIASPSVAESQELTPAQDEVVDMEQILKLSEQKFSKLLYQVTGEEDISSFMDQPLIPREQLDELGISCWYNPDPHMKLTLVRYCDKHNLGINVVPLCYTLKKSKKDLTKDEVIEYTAIYKRHLFKYPMYNQDINVFDVEGRQKLLQNELNYYKKSTTHYTNPEAEENRKIYNEYYGFRLF